MTRNHCLVAVAAMIACHPGCSSTTRRAAEAPPLERVTSSAEERALPLPAFAPAADYTLPARDPADTGQSVAAFSPDGRYLATCCSVVGERRFVHVWDLARGVLHGSVPTGNDWRSPRMEWSAQGRYLAVSDTSDLDVWLADELKRVYSAHAMYLSSQHAISPDETRIAWGHAYGGAELAELPSGNMLRRVQLVHPAAAAGMSFAWSPDGQRLVVASEYPREAEVWDRDGVPVGTAFGVSQQVAVAWSPRTPWVAIANAEGGLQVRRFDGAPSVTLRFAGAQIGRAGVAVSPDDDTVAAFGPDGSFATWSATTGEARTLMPPGEVQDAAPPAFSPDGGLLAFEHGGGLHVLDTASRRHVQLGQDVHVLGWRGARLFMHTATELRSWSRDAAAQWRLALGEGEGEIVPALASDGEWLAIARGDVVLVHATGAGLEATRLSVAHDGKAFVGRVRDDFDAPAPHARLASPPAGAATPAGVDLSMGTDHDVMALAPGLRALQLGHDQLGSGWKLPPLPEVRELILSNWHSDNATVELAPAAGLSKLTGLRCEGFEVTTLAPLAALPLHELRLDDCPLADLASLAALTELRVLAVDVGAATDLTPLASLRQLRRLRMHASDVTRLDGLEALTELVELDIDGRRLTDVSALAGLPRLERLALRYGPRLASALPLARLPRLRSLLIHEPLSAEDRAALVAALPDLVIE